MPSFLDNYVAACARKDIDGSAGQYRGPIEFNLSGANNDKDAIAAFLSQYHHSQHTLRTFTKEAERFHMFVVLELGKSIADLTVDDYQVFIQFLSDPPEAWISQKKVPKSEPPWRPFTYIEDSTPLPYAGSKKHSKGLSRAAIKLALAAVNSMLSWMVDSGYLRLNPLKILRQKDKAIGTNKDKAVLNKVERYLDNEMWMATMNAVEMMPRSTPSEVMSYERNRFILTMFTLLGSRVSELSNAKMSDIRKNVAGWFWHVTGKGDKYEVVPVPYDFIEGLMRWRQILGLPALPHRHEEIAIFPPLNRSGKPLFTSDDQAIRSGISPRRINEILKDVFNLAAQDVSLTEDRKIMLKEASAHWLRHTSITQKINAHMNRKYVQLDARHADASTTDLYTHEDETARYQEAQKHQLKWIDIT